MMDRKTVENQIRMNAERVDNIEEEIENLNNLLGDVLSVAEPDEDRAAEIQDERAELEKEKERRQIRIEVLRGKLPEIERQEDLERLEELKDEYAKLAKKTAPAVEKLNKLLEELSNHTAEMVEMSKAGNDLVGEIEYLTLKHDVEKPDLPDYNTHDNKDALNTLNGDIIQNCNIARTPPRSSRSGKYYTLIRNLKAKNKKEAAKEGKVTTLPIA